MGFTVSYSAVTWTAGDVITEAKMDNMVANDQAYDSHSAQGFEINEMSTPSTPSANKARLYAKDSGGVSTIVSLGDNGQEFELANRSFLQSQAIINAGFTVNQRVYVSDATLAAGVYGHDGWKAGTGGGDYTFTQLASSTTITIKAGKSLIQVIEPKNVVGGTYTLSWTGTAQARFGIDSATPSGAYADSPITITAQTAGTVMSVEFDDGTLGKVQLNSGSVALPFMAKSYSQEERDCLRFYQKIGSVANFSTLLGMTWGDAGTLRVTVPLVVPMRATPTYTASDIRAMKTTSTGNAGDIMSISATAPDSITYVVGANSVGLQWDDLTAVLIPAYTNIGVWGTIIFSAAL